MINSKLNSNRLGGNGSGLSYFHEQLPIAPKKIPLRDVQNENRSLLHGHPEGGGSITDHIKLSGTKRFTPDCPRSPPCHQLGSNDANDHVVYARRRFESELGERRILDPINKSADDLHSTLFCHNMQEIPQQQTEMKDHNNTYCAPAFAPIPFTSLVTFAFGEPSVPLSMEKPSKGLLSVDSNCQEVTSEVPGLVHSKETDDQRRKERFIHLGKFLKHCDESDQNNYIQMLRSFSPSELSRHAVGLEKRAIHLTFEEGKEIQRMKELNILGKSVAKNNPSPITQQGLTKK